MHHRVRTRLGDVADDRVANVSLGGEDKHRVDRRAEFHAERREVARIEIDGVGSSDLGCGAVLAGDDHAQRVFLHWRWASWSDGDGFRLSKGDGWNA